MDYYWGDSKCTLNQGDSKKDTPFSTGIAGNGLKREPLGRAVKHEAQISSHQMDTEAETPILDPLVRLSMDPACGQWTLTKPA